MEVAIYFLSSNSFCLSVSTLHSSVIMKNQLFISFSGCCLVVCLFVPGPKQEVGNNNYFILFFPLPVLCLLMHFTVN